MSLRKHPLLKPRKDLAHYGCPDTQTMLVATLANNYARMYDQVLKDAPFIETLHGKIAHVMIGADEANLFAPLNIHNRLVNDDRCLHMMDDFSELGPAAAAAGWDFITILKSGALADGQHRLQAIAAFGEKARVFPVSIRYDADDGVMRFIDHGRARTAADQSMLRHLYLKAKVRRPS